MENEANIKGAFINVVQGVGENSTVNITQILANSYQHNELLDKIKTKQKLFDRTPEDETDERLQLSTEINKLKEIFEQFKRDVLALAETFNKIEINTDRLRRAKEFFDKGEFGEARAVLETELEQMQDEQTHWLKEKEHFEKDVLPNLINNADEFYLLAMTIQTDYDNRNRFEDTCKYFEDSIKSYANKDNVFDYALFLQKHNKLKEAEKYYSQYLIVFSSQLSEDEQIMTSNNLANLYLNQFNYEDALIEYKKALKISRKLAKTNPHTYLPDVASVLNNLANLHLDQNNYEDALKGYEKALEIEGVRKSV
jgi:tetratricopeptide (TPR) repeat protein